MLGPSEISISFSESIFEGWRKYIPEFSDEGEALEFLITVLGQTILVAFTSPLICGPSA